MSRFQSGDGEVKYVREAEELIRPERNTLLVSFLDLEGFNQELADTIKEEYYRLAHSMTPPLNHAASQTEKTDIKCFFFFLFPEFTPTFAGLFVTLLGIMGTSL